MLTFDQFLSAVTQEYFKHSNLRYGQVFYNLLVDHRPDIADAINGTEYDPYMYGLSSTHVISRAIEKVLELW